MTVVERALQEMRTLVRAIQEELTQAQEKKKIEKEEEEFRKKQADTQQEEQMKRAALSVKRSAKKQGKMRILRILSEFLSVLP